MGRRIDDDARQIGRWMGVAGEKGRWKRWGPSDMQGRLHGSVLGGFLHAEVDHRILLSFGIYIPNLLCD